MNEQLVRKALRALEGQERQRNAAIEVLVRHLVRDTPDCQETINRLFDILDVPQAERENQLAEEAREELRDELEDKPFDRRRQPASLH